MKLQKTIYLHVEDPTTTFLSELYKDVPQSTIINKGLSKNQVLDQIEWHDRAVFLGHGTSLGMLNFQMFTDTNGYIIDEDAVPFLKQKTNSVFIWCYASDFQRKYGLEGISSSMFISQEDELWVGNLSSNMAKYIEPSNAIFVSILKECMHLNNQKMYEYLKEHYGKVAQTNPVAKFNCDHLYYYTK